MQEEAADGAPQQLLQLYGLWQTEEYEPPAAENGVVPRNERGNVEAPPFAKSLPRGTVHLDLPRAFAACRRLGVDHAPALVGFEPSRGGMLPKIKGVVVCAEVAEAVKASAEEDEAERQAKARQKRCACGPSSLPVCQLAMIASGVMVQCRHACHVTKLFVSLLESLPLPCGGSVCMSGCK